MQETEQNKNAVVLEALRNGEIKPYFQPQYDYAQKKVIGAEILSRWEKPDGSIGMPGTFIPVLEENDGIIEFDYHIIEEGVRILAEWRKEGVPLPHTSFNLSRRTVLDPDLIYRLEMIFKKYGFDTALFHVEVTESVYMSNYSELYGKVKILKSMGLTVEMDDFGSGYSSLGFLKDAPVDVLKLDMSFLQMDENRGKGGSIISAMVRLAGNLNMQVIAEGVETLEQAEFLKSVGCTWMQGYFFAKPMPSSDYKQELLTTGIGVTEADTFHEVNKAVDFLDDTTQSALLFNSFVGGALILEYRQGEFYPIRANERFFKVFHTDQEKMEPFWKTKPDVFDQESLARVIFMLEEAIRTEVETECEVCTDPQKIGKKQWLHLHARCLAQKKNGSYVFYVTVDDISERKVLDQRNADLTAELSSVVNNTPGGFVRFSMDDDSSRCEFLSEGWAWILGYSVEELKKKLDADGYQKMIHPEDLPKVAQAVSSMKTDLRGRRMSYRLQKKDGSWIRVGSQNSVVKGLDGMSMFIYCWDETEQEKLRAKLEVSSNELKNVIGSLQGGTALYELHTDGTLDLVDISEEAAAVSGRTVAEYKEEFLEDPLFCTFEADKERVKKCFEKAFESNKDYDVVYRLVHKNGELVWVRLRGTIAASASGKLLLYAFITNLSANFDSYDALINEADTAIVVTDLASHEILYTNRKGSGLGGIIPEEAIGKKCYECLKLKDSADHKCAAEIPPEGIELEEAREGRIYRIRRKRMNWNGIDAGVCYITDRTDSVLKENRLVDDPTIQADAQRNNQAQKAIRQADSIRQEKWESILSILRKSRSGYRDFLTEDNLRVRIQFLAVYVLMGVIALFMTVLNIVQDLWALAVVTGIFALLNTLNVVLVTLNEKAEKLAQILFGIEIISLFTIFAISGDPEGFSILWCVLLPTLGMILYRRKYGIILSMIMWLILVFLFWTGFGKSLLQYEYTKTFMNRFPILYFALAGMGYLFEYIRKTTQDELVFLRKQFEYLYNHDALTGLYNRYGFNSTIESIASWNDHGNMAFAIMDLDDFKAINDTYGHVNGDKVLKTAAMNIQKVVGVHGVVSRWGGEEFSVLFYNANESEELCEQILKSCREQEFTFDGNTIHVTISIGLVKYEGFTLGGSSEVITEADKNLYISKQSGKDRITVTDLRPRNNC